MGCRFQFRAEDIIQGLGFTSGFRFSVNLRASDIGQPPPPPQNMFADANHGADKALYLKMAGESYTTGVHM